MPQTPQTLRGACSCGAFSFEVKGSPLGRIFCHCTICQAFNEKPFADVTFFRSTDVTLINVDQVSFKKYRSPPNAARGLCLRCQKPAVELLTAGPVKLTIFPSGTFAQPQLLPPAELHAFHEHRVAEADDSLPRYSGYLRSQLAIGQMFLRHL